MVGCDCNDVGGVWRLKLGRLGMRREAIRVDVLRELEKESLRQVSKNQ